MTCPNCGSTLDDRSQFCNHCGRAQQPVNNSAEGGEPPPGYEFQQPTGDQEARPAFSTTGEGGSFLNGEKTHLILSVCCFGWAGLIGLPKAIGFLTTFIRWDWGVFSWPPLSGFFGVVVHFALPLVGALILLGIHRRNNQE